MFSSFFLSYNPRFAEPKSRIPQNLTCTRECLQKILAPGLRQSSRCQATSESDPPATLKSDPPPIFSLINIAAK